MKRDQMVITEEWRWRLLAIWVAIFTVLVAYSLYKVHVVINENRDALCAVHTTHVTDEKALKTLMEKGGLDVGEITMEIAREQAALAELGCYG